MADGGQPVNLSVPFPGRSGGSADEGKSVLFEWLREIDPKVVIDVGAGQGVYARMARQVSTAVRVIAVEVFFPSVRDYDLQRLYSDVVVADVRWVCWDRIVNKFSPDVVIMGDVLEHMRRAEAIEVMDALSWRNIPTLVSLPIVHWPQGEVDGNPFEEHVEHWSDKSFRDAFAPHRGRVCPPVGVYWVR